MSTSTCPRRAAPAPAGLAAADENCSTGTLVWNQRHPMTVLREYEDFYITHRPHGTGQASPLRPLPDSVTDLYHIRSDGVTALVA